MQDQDIRDVIVKRINTAKEKILCHNFECEDSKIIQDIEYVKNNFFGFSINWVLEYEYESLLMRAVEGNREELVRYILTYPDIDINYGKRYTSLHLACFGGCNVPILKLLLGHRDIIVDKRDAGGRGYTGLYYACMRNKIEIVRELLIDARVDVLIRNEDDKTALYVAIMGKHSRIVNMLKRVLHTSLLRIPNKSLLYDIARMIICEYT